MDLFSSSASRRTLHIVTEHAPGLPCCDNGGMRPSIGLLPKLALFFLALALPALLAMDFVRASLEFRSLTATLESDAMRSEVQREQAALARHLVERELSGLGTARDLERWVLQLARRTHAVLGEHALTLAEQRNEPIRAFLVDSRGTLVAESNTGRFEPEFKDWLIKQMDDPGANLRAHRIDERFIWLVPLQGISDRHLVLQVVLDTPAHNFLGRARIEWPIMLLDGLLFALASAFFLRAWVTARLARMRSAAAGWRAGDLKTRIADTSGDEIGAISAELDRVPDALEALMKAQGALAGADERARLARDLHDTVKQKTFGLSMQLAALEASMPRDHRADALADCRTLVADIQRSLVEIIDDLKPLPAHPLSVRLQNDIEDWSRRSGIAVSLDLAAADLVTTEPAMHIEAIVSEALANVQRHSGARRVNIQLTHDQSRFTLRIEDNGSGGAKPGSTGSGRGLDHLASRAQDMPSGSCHIDSDERGTRIVIRWFTSQSPTSTS